MNILRLEGTSKSPVIKSPPLGKNHTWAIRSDGVKRAGKGDKGGIQLSWPSALPSDHWSEFPLQPQDKE